MINDPGKYIYLAAYHSPIGLLYIGTENLSTVCWCSPIPPEREYQLIDRFNSPLLFMMCRYLDEYFAGVRQYFYDIPLQAQGTSFQKRIWETLTKVQYGTTISYAELARLAGSPRAIRAVANAVARNDLLIIYPCHRVIRSDGSIGQYRLGTAVKTYLLDLEKKKSTFPTHLDQPSVL